MKEHLARGFLLKDSDIAGPSQTATTQAPEEREARARVAKGFLGQPAPLPIEEWARRAAPDLLRDIRCHLSEWQVADPDGLERLIMISVRQWSGR